MEEEVCYRCGSGSFGLSHLVLQPLNTYWMEKGSGTWGLELVCLSTFLTSEKTTEHTPGSLFSNLQLHQQLRAVGLPLKHI